MKKTIKYLIITIIVIVVLSFTIYALTRPDSNGDPRNEINKNSGIVSESGIHWHPELVIYIKGQKQEIPQNVGIGPQYTNNKWYNKEMGMAEIHTHEDLPLLHWEVPNGPVAKDKVRLGTFFEVWGKTFNSTQIFDKRNGPEGTVKMTVNGQPNTEFDNYLVNDKDKIEIRFE